MNPVRISWIIAASAAVSPALEAQQTGPITADGRYVWTVVNKSPDWNKRSLVIQSTGDDGWKKEIPGVGGATFTEDNRRIIYQSNDTLVILTLGTNERILIPGVASYRAPGVATGRRLVYQPKAPSRELVLRDLETGGERRFLDVSRHFFAPHGHGVVLASDADTADNVSTLRWSTLSGDTSRTIWRSTAKSAPTPVFDTAGTQLAFMVSAADSDDHNAIWHYRFGADSASVLVRNGSPGIDSGLFVAKAPVAFGPKGARLFFILKEGPLPPPDSGIEMVDVWSYLDVKVQSQQFTDLVPLRFSAAVGIGDGRVIRITGENELVIPVRENPFGPDDPIDSDDYAIVCRFEGDVITYDRDGVVVETYTMNEYNWNRGTLSTIYLVSLRDGSRTVLQEKIKPTYSAFPYFRLSPGGEYVLYYDQVVTGYFSYHIPTGKTTALTSGVRTTWSSQNREAAPRGYYEPVGIQGWFEDGSTVLLADKWRDLWRVDLTGKVRPVSVTNGYARRAGVALYDAGRRAATYAPDEKLFLTAAVPWESRRYRNAGLVEVSLDASRRDPRILVPIGGAYRYQLSGTDTKDSVFVVVRENAKTPATTYYTRDFKAFTAVTNDAPEERRGVSQELITWTMADGTKSQGILLKPADFDPKKKYPVVFYYYELMSHEFDQFRVAEHEQWVKDGYLVFKPDIHYRIGYTGPSVTNSVASAARHLAKLPYVNARRMGIIGASFGGFETNYLVTHTSNLFAAAISGCGFTDYFSYYLTEDKDEQGYLYATGAEVGQSRLGVTPWERPDLYIASSSIFTADKVTTPLLLYNSYSDYRVPFSQSLELFKALRRLGKPVWLLQSGEGHCGGNYGKRFEQFFAHYLKGEPAPRWMTRGVPARKRGTDPGLDLDPTVTTPGKGIRFEDEARTPDQVKLIRKKTGKKGKAR